ncbi:argininosuccinate lyase [Verminephrobacter eiseniae]|uniref:argininosuccinate lyase n=1 Tax=Verminephrobacter eiseniae TaxID=364317 RepID=UPI0010F0AB12|nr:argininosuccinate lyase [Verminephrobacter eiseniae]KAB7572207.1 argininosuccinate lyase [Verminephrobacter sp. Larva24]MCW5229799.1 argininosuccinate lyase [Verminephrobacter eiseniae]MCW5291530.1 argininosuccinate lyase [Verminephrobacter eiseniae]MCW8186465.1 argininosuccinate lyase [Verminephrobacter eiseniae]MCW8222861.1 argininosuccinate lyase [Verminephrobacter eiseniae]
MQTQVAGPTQRLWGARFRSEPSAALKALSRSEPGFFRLVPYDLAGSRAHARELHRAGILKSDELEQLLAGVDALEQDYLTGAVRACEADEDVHTFLERVLTERLGPLGGKLRAGRSRNDQAANDLKLYLRDKARVIAAAVHDLQSALIAQAQQHIGTLSAGFTHLQPAQPIVFAHHLMAHVQAVGRNIDRLIDWDRRSARSPLGAAALAGSAICRSPELSAAELGYDAPCENSIDAVAARDHVCEFLFVCSMLAVELSRLSEEVVLWSSRQFQWVELDDGYCTGSSIMPQKKNPDIAELSRGKAGRLIGNLVGMLSALKSLPLAYNRDLAEDKSAAFDSIDTLSLVLPALAAMIRTMRIDVERLRRQAPLGFTLATEVADWLALSGVPFSEAHEITGALVQACEAQGIELSAVSQALLAQVDARLTPEVLQHLTLDAAIGARTGYGGTAPQRVREQIARAQAALARQGEWTHGAYAGPRC